MKRMHVHVAVEDLRRSIGFYSALFAARPAVVKSDYAKWMLDDPRVNFAISTRGREPGLDHLGIQVEEPRRTARGLCPPARGRRRRSSSRGRPRAATPSRKSRGSTTPPASRGRPSSPPAKARITATAPASAMPAWRMPSPMPSPVAHRRPQRRRHPRPAVPRKVHHERSPIQRAVPVHRQFGALDHGGSDLEQAGRGTIPRLQRGKPAEGTGQPAHPAAPAKASTTTLPAFARSRGTSSPEPARRRSISCSPSATTPRPKHARCGRASR